MFGGSQHKAMLRPTEQSPEHHQVYSPRPVFTRAGTTTTIHGTEVYFTVSTHGYDCPLPVLDRPTRMPHYVWKYNCVEEECSVIEDCLDVHDFGLAVVNEQLVVVGGEKDLEYNPREVSSEHFLSDEEPDKEVLAYFGVLDLNKAHYGWQYDIFPAMSKPRKQPAVICMKQYLVVAGGQLHGELLSLVEVLNTESKVWSQVTSRTRACTITNNSTLWQPGIFSWRF